MKYLGVISDPKDVTNKKYVDDKVGEVNTSLTTLSDRVDTAEDNIQMAESDIGDLQAETGTLKTDMTTVKGAVKTLQDTYVPNTTKINGKALEGDITLTPGDIGAARTTTYTASVGTSWTTENNYVRQNIAVSGIWQNYTPIIDLVATTENYEAEQEAWSKIFKITCGVNAIVLYASEAPTTAFDIQIKVVR